ncbi:MAG: ATP-binding protein [Achromobacter sp.]
MNAFASWRQRFSRRSAARGYSLRRRLIATTVGSSIVCGLICVAIVIGIAWHETSDAFDDALEEGARLSISLGASMARSGVLTTDDDEQVDNPRKRVHLYYQLIDDDGDVVRRARGAPKRPFVDSDRKSDRFYNTWVDGKLWRVYVLRQDNPDISVQIGQHWDDRNDLLYETIEDLAWPAIGLWLLLALVNWIAIRRLLRPLETLAQGIAAKSPNDLTPVPDTHQPHELQPMLASLNLVLGRLSTTLESERRFTADAAHELRTPLAGLSSKIQLMQRHYGASAPAALQDDLVRLRQDVARSTALVENLLLLARLDPQEGTPLERAQVEVAAVLREAAQASTPAAAARGIAIDVTCETDSVFANRQLLYSAIRNLVDNAVKYGVDGGRVQLKARAMGAAVEIRVCDDGPGVSEADRARLTQRFFRVLGSNTTGSGLGLSIVARIAALHGATLSFLPGDNGRGLCATLQLPPSA